MNLRVEIDIPRKDINQLSNRPRSPCQANAPHDSTQSFQRQFPWKQLVLFLVRATDRCFEKCPGPLNTATGNFELDQAIAALQVEKLHRGEILRKSTCSAIAVKARPILSLKTANASDGISFRFNRNVSTSMAFGQRQYQNRYVLTEMSASADFYRPSLLRPRAHRSQPSQPKAPHDIFRWLSFCLEL